MSLPVPGTMDRLLQLLEQNTGAEVFFNEDEEGWDWTIRQRHLESRIIFSNPEEAITDMIAVLIEEEVPVLRVGTEYD